MTSDEVGDEGHYKKRLDDPCSFRLEISTKRATRREIIARLKETLHHVETLTKAFTSGGKFWIDWRIDDE